MKKLLSIILLSSVTIIFAHAQNYVASDLVSPVQITPSEPNATLPSGFRLANVDFLTPAADEYASSAMILDGHGDVVWRHTTPLNLSGNNGSMFNFNRVNDTTLTLYEFSSDGGFHLVLNNDYHVIDTVRAVGQFDRTQPHELLVLPNGNYWTMGQRFELIDQNLIGIEVKPGVVITESTLIENVAFQEITPDGILVKECWTLDHVDPQAVWDTSKIQNASQIALLHPNSGDYFFDQGELKFLISFRGANQLIVFNWYNETIDWKVQGRNPNMFFVPELYSGDVLDLHAQHYAKILEWDNVNRKLTICVFNNRFHVERAEGLVLVLEFNTNIVRKLKSFVASPELKSTHLGNVDLYNEGNHWLVNWGRTYEGRENATGYNQYGIKQFDLFLPDSVDSYRILPIEQPEMDALLLQRPTITQDGCTLSSETAGYWQDGSFGMTFEVMEPGEFFVEVPHGIGFLRSESVMIQGLDNACGTIGITEHEQRVTIYPNPAEHFVQVTGIPVHIPYEMRSVDGKLIVQKILYNERIDLSGLESGIYLIKFKTKDGSFIHRIVKM